MRAAHSIDGGETCDDGDIVTETECDYGTPTCTLCNASCGMDLVLTIGAIEDLRFEAKLEHISPKGVEENGAIQFEIRAAVKLRDDVFVRANYSANADIVLDRRDEVLAIDEGLLQFEDQETFVEVETSPQVFERRAVETGLSDGIYIEIISGLSETDRIKNPQVVR